MGALFCVLNPCPLINLVLLSPRNIVNPSTLRQTQGRQAQGRPQRAHHKGTFMKAGQAVRQFTVDRKDVTIRYPAKGDIDKLMKFINSLVKERVYIGTQKRVTRKQEEEWLAARLNAIKINELVYLVVEINDNIVGGASITPSKMPWRTHVGSFDIGLAKLARGKGIGHRLFKALLAESKKRFKISILELEVMSINKRAYRFYQKMGFKKVGIIKGGLKYYHRHVDQIIMVKYLR